MTRRRRRFGCLTKFLALVLLLALAYGVDKALDAFVFAPWAYGIFGRATLTGDWNGTLRTAGGTPYALYLQLDRSSRALAGPHSPDIDGHVSWCTRGAPSTTFAVHGTSDRSASNVTLGTEPPDHVPRGLFPSQFHGAWHGSTLVMQVQFALSNGHGGIITSSAIPDLARAASVTLRKKGYDAFQAACAHL
jgi:hypothetical protein